MWRCPSQEFIPDFLENISESPSEIQNEYKYEGSSVYEHNNYPHDSHGLQSVSGDGTAAYSNSGIFSTVESPIFYADTSNYLGRYFHDLHGGPTNLKFGTEDNVLSEQSNTEYRAYRDLSQQTLPILEQKQPLSTMSGSNGDSFLLHSETMNFVPKEHNPVPHVPEGMGSVNNTQLTQDLPVYVGVVKRYLEQENKPLKIFVDELPLNCPLRKLYPKFPNCDCCLMCEEKVKEVDPNLGRPMINTVVLFHGAVRGQDRKYVKPHNMFFAQSVVAFYPNVSAAMQALGIPEEDGITVKSEELAAEDQTNKDVIYPDVPDKVSAACNSKVAARDLPTYIGVVQRFLVKSNHTLIFVDKLMDENPLQLLFPKFPNCKCCLLTEEKVGDFDPKLGLPMKDSVVIFRGVVRGQDWTNSKGLHKFFAQSVVGLYPNMSAAMEAFAIPINISTPQNEESSTDGTTHRGSLAPNVQQSSLYVSKYLTPAELMARKGIKNNEDFDKYWRKFRPKLPQNEDMVRRMHSVNTQPLQLDSEVVFLERLARSRALDGKLPRTMCGPFTVYAMWLALQHTTELCQRTAVQSEAL